MDSQPTNLDSLIALYRTMARIRAFEQTAWEAHKAGETPGVLHISLGQEAVPAGVCAHLRRTDRLTSTHRGHGHAIAKGADPARMMAELFGRATGFCGGKGGSMHIADFSVGMLGANGVVAGGIPIAVGAAQGLKLLGDPPDPVVACFFGDGAVNRGPFLEGLNWAALYRLPVLFVCEDNSFAAFTRASDTTAGPGPAARAEACGVPTVAVDGTDALAVDIAARDAISAIRAGSGPVMLHARLYRWEGHTATDPATWRPADEVAAAKTRDPLVSLARELASRGWDGAERAQAEARAEMQAARDAARAAPWPEPHAAFEDVQGG